MCTCMCMYTFGCVIACVHYWCNVCIVHVKYNCVLCTCLMYVQIIYLCMHIYTCKYIHVHTFIQVRMYIHVHTCIHISVVNIITNMWSCIVDIH